MTGAESIPATLLKCKPVLYLRQSTQSQVMTNLESQRHEYDLVDVARQGMKGSITEFELGVLRTRMLDATRSKARRGELRLSVPSGYIWHREAGLGFDPDLRLQEVIRHIFARLRELGGARQALLSMKADQIHFPRPSDKGRMTSFTWLPIRFRNVISVLKNPFCAGVYVYGKSEKRASIVDGRARRSYGHGKRQKPGRSSSRISTRATSVGRTKSASRSSWSSPPMAAPAAQSQGGVARHCSRGS